MIAILKREIRSFFGNPLGYMIIGLFLVLCGLFLWVFRGNYNLFDYGFAEMDLFFGLVPWIFIFLVPAITMKSFSEEKRQGTLELLFIKPISLTKVVLGKFLGALTLLLLALLPTLLYPYALSQLGTTLGNIDMGVVWGSYFGLVFLSLAFVSIGVFCSSLTQNQVMAFILATVLCFLLYFGFDSLASLFSEGNTIKWIENLGMRSHYQGVSRGIIDLKDLIYFLSVALLFLAGAVFQLKNMKR
jgi:ABC-2 type transport system permease protein